ncbi:ABC transporter, permease protein (cluster 3, basic aa/glutamine/opines), partial [Pseudomonas sp. FEN]
GLSVRLPAGAAQRRPAVTRRPVHPGTDRHRHLARGQPGHCRRRGQGLADPPLRGDLRRLRRIDPQHAVPGAAVFHFLRPAVPRPADFRVAGSRPGNGDQPRRLFHGDYPRRYPGNPARTAGGRGGAGHDPLRSVSPRGPAAGAGQGLAGPEQPDHHRHARLGGLLADRHRGVELRRQLHPVAQFPRLRNLHPDHADLPGHGAADPPVAQLAGTPLHREEPL